jgi:hypothetical protein
MNNYQSGNAAPQLLQYLAVGGCLAAPHDGQNAVD